MRINEKFYNDIKQALVEKITTTPTDWADIVAHIKGKGIVVKNWLHVRAVLQDVNLFKRTNDVHKEQYVVR